MTMALLKPQVVDLSHFNAGFDFRLLVNAGVVGVIHKASQGFDFQDPDYAARRTEATAAGLLWGAYHFLDDADIDDQLQNFVSAASPDGNTLMALDFEQNGANTAGLDQLFAALDQLQGLLNGRSPVLYCGDYLREQMGTTVDPRLSSRRLWIADYGPSPCLQASWNNYWLWQYTDGTAGPNTPLRLPGIDSAVDLDVSAGTVAELKSQWAG